MNPLLTEVSTMTITSTPHSFFNKLQSLQGSRPRRSEGHPKASSELQYIVPERITDPATATGAALTLCRNRWDELTVVLYMDNQHRLVGHAVVATGWVQAALLTSRPILSGADACQASRCILVCHRPYGAPNPSEAEDRSFRTIAAACARHGVAVVNHLVVVGCGSFTSVGVGL
jgi:DNA repair protein RadC